MTMKLNPTRRHVVLASAGLAASVLVRPALAQTDELAAAVTAYAGGQKVTVGKVKLDIAELVDNGNVVPVTLQVLPPPSVSASAVSRLHGVAALALFNERNPQREVIEAHFGPLSGRAQFSTRVRLATTQRLVAVAKMQDGQCWYSSAQVIVTLAACIESDD